MCKITLFSAKLQQREHWAKFIRRFYPLFSSYFRGL